MESIERYWNTDNDYWNNHTLGIYESARKEGIFDDLEVPLRYFELYENIFRNNRKIPVQVTAQLMAAMKEEGLNAEQQNFIMMELEFWFGKTVFHDNEGKEYSMEGAKKIIYLERPVAKKEKEESSFDFGQLKKILEAIPDTAQKIKHLLEQEALYKQQHDWVSKGWAGTDFGKQCRVEIKKLEKILALEAKSNPPNVQASNIFLAKKQGAKTNLLRVVDALWEMRYFTDQHGQTVTRGEVMAAFGQLLNEDLSAFESALSQSYNNTRAETNLAIFEEMKVKIQGKCMPK